MAKTEEEILEGSEKELIGEFTLKKENSRILKGIIETLANVIDEGLFTINKKEFIFEAMDPSRICLLRLSIKKTDFDEFTCKKACKVGINLDDLDKILKRSGTNDSIELSYKAEDRKIKIKIKREDAERTRNFSLAVLDLEYEDLHLDNLQKIEYTNIININPEIIVEALKDAEIYSEIFNVKATEKGLVFSAVGQIGEMSYELLKEEEFPDANLNSDSLGAFSIIFLKNILKIASITEKLEISLRTDHPLKMIFNILEGGELLYFLAPRVEEEEYEDDDDDMDYYDEKVEKAKDKQDDITEEEIEEDEI